MSTKPLAPAISILDEMVPPDLTPARLNAELALAGLDPEKIRKSIDAISQAVGAEFAVGLLAGIRYGIHARTRGCILN